MAPPLDIHSDPDNPDKAPLQENDKEPGKISEPDFDIIGPRAKKMDIVLLDMEKLERMLEPRAELKKKKDIKYELSTKMAYLIEDDAIGTVFRIFQDMVHHGTHGLAITRHLPVRYRKRYDIQNTPFIWLTTNISDDEVCITPSHISKLSKAIISFLDRTDMGIVLFTGIEYLIAQNGFLTVLNLISLINDKIMAGNDILLVSINPLSFTTQELNILRSELTRFSPHE